MKETYAVGVIGCGRMAGSIDDEMWRYPNWKGPYSHAAGYAACERTRIVAACDPLEEKRRVFGERYGIPATNLFADHREMLAKVPLDIVSVTTHAPAHCEPVLATIEAGVPAVFCEKPLASSLEECDAMVSAAEVAGTVTAVGTLRRWGGVWNQITGMIESGDAGAPLQVVQFSGGTLLHTESHFFDLGRYLLGNPVPAWAVGHLIEPVRSDDGTMNDCRGHGYVRFDSGAEYYLVGPGCLRMETELHCEKATFRVYNNGDSARMWTAKPDSESRYTKERAFEIDRDAPSGTLAAVSEIVACLDNGGETRCSFRDGLYAVEMGMAFHESERRGNCRVDWPLEDRSLKVMAR